MSFGVVAIVAVLVVLVLLVAVKKVPDVVRSLGRGRREFDRGALEESADASTAGRAGAAAGGHEDSRAA